MPARSERIILVPDEGGQPVRIMEFPFWWDRGAFIENYRSREIDPGNPIDANFAWLLSAGEAVAWNEKCKKEFSRGPDGGNSIVLENMRLWEAALAQAGWVIVESYEWESGLD
jgi:hypothetical protein